MSNAVMFHNNYSGSTNTVNGYSIVDTVQTRNSGKKQKVMDVIDDTEGCGAMDTLYLSPQTRNLDLGGGQYDTVSHHILYFYQVINYVYDPFHRTQTHNNQIMKVIEKEPVDTVTSHSVLNVILEKCQRKQHINLAYQSLRKGGTAFFKVWRGDGSATMTKTQSNLEALHYFDEFADIFGEKNICIPQDNIGNTIIAKKI